ncbi:hypothetical protein ALI144C_26200 [Actinosynnema sp. ALI-1.44]|uniref:hypothetical protein n=1 Tax=Actinosynnema sp. ALI-1.44 TaxID=1933779 RepID=UPI00097C8FA3|nr:hypothetical protein [Actinosynnema sp. ALI-1.44]ONI79316.1 hypothetical protein ALI144C_26200 [Actinosynnema sp. ALI-1.44]
MPVLDRILHRIARLRPDGIALVAVDGPDAAGKATMAARALLLDPLSPGGDGRYRRSAYEFRTSTAAIAPVEQAPPNAVLLVDGVFLLRPQPRSYWDLSSWTTRTPRGQNWLPCVASLLATSISQV